MDWIQQQMINGWQVTFEDAFTFHPSLIGKMNGPDDPLPASKDLLQGFAGSAVSNLAIKVNNFSALTDMVRNAYAGRVVDVLEVKTGNN
jgi:hypothetical protein